MTKDENNFVFKELPVAIYSPGRRFVELSIEVELNPKAPERLTDLFRNYCFNPVMALAVGNFQVGKRHLEIFLDYTEATISLEELAEKIRETPGVFNVRYRRGLREDLVLRQLCYPPTILGERVAIFRYSMLKSWFNRLWEVYGSGAGAILYDVGVKIGKDSVKNLREHFKLGGEMLLNFLACLATSLGWGKFILGEFDKETCKLKVRVEDSFECRIAKEAGESRGYLIRGYIFGVATEIFQTENLTIEESKCIAKGDPYCEYHVKP